ncbi:MAG TPA: hypothetical protein VHM25_12610, partial [Polyangiaceae bacterium]|nr:hypothetical protein [Polyangiaceae bacterium]
MSRPSLVVQTVYFGATDRPHAEELGLVLYDHLTRPSRDKLAFGPGIPVRIAAAAASVDLDEADRAVLIPVLGLDTVQVEDARANVVETLDGWQDRLKTGLLLPVLTTESWRPYQEDLPREPLLQYLEEDQQRGFQSTLLEIVLRLCGLLQHPSHKKLRMFISHANADLESTKEAARQIRDFSKANPSADALYDVKDLEAAGKLDPNSKIESDEGIFLVVRSDAYASRSRCGRELLWAKRSGIPTLGVEVLRAGEARSHPYAGNRPTTVWDGQPLKVVVRAMVEWLRARHFRLEQTRLTDGLPELEVLTQPPELLDLAQGPLVEARSSVILHPDPELSYAEQLVLRAMQPRLKLITPTTLYRAINGSGSGTAPLSFSALRER